MSPLDELLPILKKLRLSGVLETLEIRLGQARDDETSHASFLLQVLTDEVERRQGKQLDTRLKRAQFDQQKTFDDFEFAFNGKIPRSKLMDLATTKFIEKHENICFVGQTGVGKSHLAQAIGQRACMRGYNVLYLGATEMLQQLRVSRADNSRDKKLARLVGVDLLIIDDLGLRPLGHEEPVDLYDVIRGRYERGSTIITSNRAMEEWAPLFCDELLANAALDRLLHHAHVIELTGKSYRARKALGETTQESPAKAESQEKSTAKKGIK